LIIVGLDLNSFLWNEYDRSWQILISRMQGRSKNRELKIWVIKKIWMDKKELPSRRLSDMVGTWKRKVKKTVS